MISLPNNLTAERLTTNWPYVHFDPNPTLETPEMTTDPHEREYLAAATGIAEQTPLPEFDLAVGDFISGVSGGKRWQGRVDWIAEDGRICIDVGGGWVYVSSQDITH